MNFPENRNVQRPTLTEMNPTGLMDHLNNTKQV